MTLLADQDICAYLEGTFRRYFGSQSYCLPGTVPSPVSDVISAGSIADPATNIVIALFQDPIGVDTYFDNMIVKPDDERNHMIVNVTFGEGTEYTLDGLLERARGALIVRVFTKKNSGAGTARIIGSAVKGMLMEMSCVKKRTSGLFLRIREISGPESFPNVHQSYYMTRISAGWEASQAG
jgi:hypothetical protein